MDTNAFVKFIGASKVLVAIEVSEGRREKDFAFFLNVPACCCNSSNVSRNPMQTIMKTKMYVERKKQYYQETGLFVYHFVMHE